MSILLVLASHLLPLGPNRLGFNYVAGAAGMALFFCLSGFLIVTFLYGGMKVPEFLKKRLARILPLAWLAMALLAVWSGATSDLLLRNLAFVSNLPPAAFLPHGEHLWSLCVEVQFYAVAALLALVAGRKGMLAIPVLCLAVTAARIADHQTISVVTWHRVDEILAGGVLALLYAHGWHKALRFVPFWLAVLALLICSHPASGPLAYLRPYASALLVGTTLVAAPERIRRLLVSAPMAYVASISYALYVIHGMLTGTWLGSGATLEKYLKRPLLIAATFALAHLSTRYVEAPFLRLARRKASSGK